MHARGMVARGLNSPTRPDLETIAFPCHCEKRSDEAIFRLMSHRSSGGGLLSRVKPGDRFAPRNARGRDNSSQGENALAAKQITLLRGQTSIAAPLASTSERNFPQWNTNVRSSMLSRGAMSGGAVGSSNAVCGAKRARPSVAES